MAEVSGEQWQADSNVAVGAIAIHHRMDGEAVTEVVQPWSAGGRSRLEAGLTHQTEVGPVDVAIQQPGTCLGDEQAGYFGLWMQFVASPEIGAEGLDRGHVEGQFARLPNLLSRTVSRPRSKSRSFR